MGSGAARAAAAAAAPAVAIGSPAGGAAAPPTSPPPDRPGAVAAAGGRNLKSSSMIKNKVSHSQMGKFTQGMPMTCGRVGPRPGTPPHTGTPLHGGMQSRDDAARQRHPQSGRPSVVRGGAAPPRASGPHCPVAPARCLRRIAQRHLACCCTGPGWAVRDAPPPSHGLLLVDRRFERIAPAKAPHRRRRPKGFGCIAHHLGDVAQGVGEDEYVPRTPRRYHVPHPDSGPTPHSTVWAMQRPSRDPSTDAPLASPGRWRASGDWTRSSRRCCCQRPPKVGGHDHGAAQDVHRLPLWEGRDWPRSSHVLIPEIGSWGVLQAHRLLRQMASSAEGANPNADADVGAHVGLTPRPHVGWGRTVPFRGTRWRLADRAGRPGERRGVVRAGNRCMLRPDRRRARAPCSSCHRQRCPVHRCGTGSLPPNAQLVLATLTTLPPKHGVPRSYRCRRAAPELERKSEAAARAGVPGTRAVHAR